MIKDSGNRREFESGAVRDIQEGKGRCDLMPLDVVGDLMADGVILRLAEYQKSGDVVFLKSAVLWFCKVSIGDDKSNTIALADYMLELAVHFEEGAKKYGENNWQKGLPPYCYLDSGVRHYLKFLRGDTDERHDRAFLWNMVCLIWTLEHTESDLAQAEAPAIL